MNPWVCFALIAAAGALGGVINAVLTDNGFTFPKREKGIWCPGALSNILIGSAAAVGSWSLYGSGAAIDLAKQAGDRPEISLTFSALTGAFIVGVGGAKWITNEVDKNLLKESIREAVVKDIPRKDCNEILKESPVKVLEQVSNCPGKYI